VTGPGTPRGRKFLLSAGEPTPGLPTRGGTDDHTPTPERPAGCVARRRDAYYAAIATRGNLTTRLNLTTTHGMPHPLSHTA
jgi:hypothetical protein